MTDSGEPQSIYNVILTRFSCGELAGEELNRFLQATREDRELAIASLEILAIESLYREGVRRDAVDACRDEVTHSHITEATWQPGIPDSWAPDTELVDDTQQVETAATESPPESEPRVVSALLYEIAEEFRGRRIPTGTATPLHLSPPLEAGLNLFESSGLPDLAQRYEALEFEVPRQLLQTVRQAFVRAGHSYDEDSDTLVCGDSAFSPTAELTWSSRFLQIHSRNVTDADASQQLLHIPIPDSFGVIRDIACALPCIRGVDYGWLEQALHEQLSALYGSLRSTLIGHVEGIQAELFDPLVRIIDEQLERSGKGHLVDRYFPVLGHRDIFCYFLDRRKLIDVAEQLTANQLPHVGPCELMLELVRTRMEPNEALGAKAHRAKSPVRESFECLNYRGDKRGFARAEQVLYRSPGHTVFSVAERRGYVVALCMPDTVERVLVPELELAAPRIDHCLREGLSGYSAFVETMHSVRSLLLPTHEWRAEGDALIFASGESQTVFTADDSFSGRTTT